MDKSIDSAGGGGDRETFLQILKYSKGAGGSLEVSRGFQPGSIIYLGRYLYNFF